MSEPEPTQVSVRPAGGVPPLRKVGAPKVQGWHQHHRGVATNLRMLHAWQRRQQHSRPANSPKPSA